MILKRFLLVCLATVLLLCFAFPVYAGPFGGSTGSSGLGAGVMFPDIDGVETDNSFYYLFDYISFDYLFEINYFNDADMDGWMIHGDYLYPVSSAMNNELYVGAGYSYLFANSGVLDDDNAFNICAGFNAMEKLDIRARYIFLNGGDKLFTVGGTYVF